MRAFDRLKKRRAPPSPLLPVLRHDEWPMVWQCAHRSLMVGRRGPGIPFVALARQRGDGLDFLLRDSLQKLELTYDEAEEFAVQNLCRTRAQWEILHSHEVTERPLMMSLRGGMYTASRVLDLELMRSAHQLTGSRLLLVSVPSQRELYATDASPTADVRLFKAFEEWTVRHWQRAEGIDALSKRAFLVKDGVIEGIFNPPEA